MMAKSKGLRTEPCGIPFSSVVLEERVDPIRTWNDLELKNDVIHANILPLISILLILYNKPSRHTMS